METALRMQAAQTAASSPVLREACAALSGVIPRFADLVRSAPNPAAPAVGDWTVADVAAHVAHACAGNLLAAGTLGPTPTEGFPEGDDLIDAATRFNAWNLAGDPERDLGVLAVRIEQRGDEFLATMATAADDDKAAWLAGPWYPRPRFRVTSSWSVSCTASTSPAPLANTGPSTDRARPSRQGFFRCCLDP